MKIAAICCTYGRPAMLGRAIECFNRQTHENRVLLVLDDAGQYSRISGDRWDLLSGQKRFATLGEKRNAAVEFALARWPDIDAIAPWDDDDVHLPGHLEACCFALAEGGWCQPSQILVPTHSYFRRMWASREDDHHNRGYHSSWAFRREAFERIGGYAAMNNGEDADIAERARQILGPSIEGMFYVPPEEGKVPEPSHWFPTYAYNSHGTHLSSMGPDGYAKLGRQKIDPVTELDISWPEDYSKWPIDDEVLPRNW